jgi:protein gp37
MSINSSIEWTECTWNPVTGCTKISRGCKNCYAERMARRLQAIGYDSYKNGFNFSVHSHLLGLPLKWKKPKKIFVNSMSDLFHREAPTSFIHEVFQVMNEARRHNFQVLTKRSQRLMTLSKTLPWPENVWMGVTVEDADYVDRIDHLRKTGAKVKFLSIEPLLGPLPKLNLRGIDWVIVGGESGPGSRPMQLEWVREIRDRCLKTNVPFFFKQWGGRNKKKAGRELDGRTWDDLPKLNHS